MKQQRVVISPSLSSQAPPISNANLGMLLFVAGEVMLFAGLLACYVVLRFGTGNFAGMHRLPVGLTGVSTPLLVASSLALLAAARFVKRGSIGLFKLAAVATLLLGASFLLLQYSEWHALLTSGVLPSVNVYGGMFYMLSWMHGLHVAGGIILLAVLATLALLGRVTADRRTIVSVASIYWHFVTLVWMGLFVVLFLV